MWRCNMIYKKDANFPYPILTNTSNSYENCNFTLEVNLEENTNDYEEIKSMISKLSKMDIFAILKRIKAKKNTRYFF